MPVKIKQTIIITTDFSEHSLAAFPYAIEQVNLRGKENTKVVLLCVLEDTVKTNVSFGFGLAFLDSDGVLENAFKAAIEKTEQLARDNLAEIEAEPVVIPASGPVYHSIVDFADNEAASLILIATHGRTGAKHLFLGSVAERVVREAHCPVMVVPSYKRTIRPLPSV